MEDSWCLVIVEIFSQENNVMETASSLVYVIRLLHKKRYKAFLDVFLALAS
jgi:hypothetical protein